MESDKYTFVNQFQIDYLQFMLYRNESGGFKTIMKNLEFETEEVVDYYVDEKHLVEMFADDKSLEELLGSDGYPTS